MRPCGVCERHFREEPRCPFCGAERGEAPAKDAAWIAPIAAAVLGAALAGAACKPDPAPVPPYGVPPPIRDGGSAPVAVPAYGVVPIEIPDAGR